MAHVGMYFVGGKYLCMWRPEIALPCAHLSALAVFAAITLGLDLMILYLVVFIPNMAHDAGFAIIRRLCMILQRLPITLSLMVMTILPYRLCHDLSCTLQAVEARDTSEAQRLYCAFWEQLRRARHWYNAVATAHFVIDTARMPVGFYILTHWTDVQSYPLFVYFIFAYTALGGLEMLVWIMPAFLIRKAHGQVLRGAIVAAGQQDRIATTFATMVGSLHPKVGLKMMGFLVSWRLMAQIQLLAALVTAGLRFLLEPGSPSPLSATSTS
jgi:hypothetical protein